MDQVHAARPVPWKGGILCSTVELVALAVWVGGLATILVTVIPEVFNLGVVSGGRLLTKVFARYNTLVMGMIGLLGALAVLRWWLSAKRGVIEASMTRGEACILIVMVLIHVLLVVMLVPESVARQEAAFAAEGDAARKAAHEAFFQSHKFIRSLYVINFALGLGLIAVKVGHWTGIRRLL